MWNLPAPPGFQGLHPEKPLTIYERHLPHWRQDGASYFVTFRLADSPPQTKLDELAQLKMDWERIHPPPRSHAVLEKLVRAALERMEKWLDQGMGSCVLKQRHFADLVQGSMHHFDAQRYELGAYVVMPNHVHCVIRPYKPDEYPLEMILGSWKSFSSRRINAELAKTGDLWQDESFDRIIRDEEHLWRVIQYIGRNPSLAGLESAACLLWIRPEWEQLGWKFE